MTSVGEFFKKLFGSGKTPASPADKKKKTAMTEKVRYSRTRSGRKNTLYTQRIGPVIYYGIARCNLKEDRFSKDQGLSLAKSRLAQAKQSDELPNITGELRVREKLSGAVYVGDVKALLRQFDSLE